MSMWRKRREGNGERVGVGRKIKTIKTVGLEGGHVEIAGGIGRSASDLFSR